MQLNCKHPHAKQFIVNGLFDGISEFSELEDRISKITPEKTKGDAFEVFVEAYLATQRKHDAESVWPSSEAPNAVLKELNLPAGDKGVDGIFKTTLGRYSVYQVKFRTSRPSLTWREISTFMGLSDGEKIENRVLITNCDSITDVVSQRNDFFCIRGSDFDRLTAADFADILFWIKGEQKVVQKKTRLGHQIAAVEAICGGLKLNSRVTATMACGTGKTLVALWTVEDLGAKKVLLLFPSLSLIRQTLHEWLKETRIDKLSYICVCSDATVAEGQDMPSVSKVDLDFRVTTSPDDVRRFMGMEFEGTKLIFSTYQSAKVVGSAMSPDESFDLAVFDEAHKTAGSEGRNLTFALEDKNIKIAKRVFLTATPKHYRPHSAKLKSGNDDNLVFSMDRPEVYGPRVYTLPFSKAIEIGVICKYKVIVSAITSDKIDAEMLNRGLVSVNGDEVQARQVANQIAICDAVSKYGVKKIFTFHSKVASAKSFVADTSEGIPSHLPGYIALHVNGEMSTADREKIIKEFKHAPAALISNARCLTEGVDVPAVDMVAFLSPRRSIVDIVQAAGRAMRTSPGKDMGYILVPLYVKQESGETIEEAVKRADYTDVWEVLNSLMEHDDMLYELIRGMAQGVIKKGSSDTRDVGDIVDFGGPSIDLKSLKETISTFSIEALYSPWDVHYGELIKYKEKFGDCNVPAPQTIGNSYKELGSWVVSQRVLYRKGQLDSDKVKLLEEVGFNFDYQSTKTDQTWYKWYEELKKYKLENGHCRIPRTDKTRSKLASWVWIQRIRKDRKYGKAEKLTEEQVGLLDEIGFLWDPRESSWENQYSKLKAFFNKNGHSAITQEDAQLYAWCGAQRDKYRAGKLSEQQIQKLLEVKFTFDSAEAAESNWRLMLNELKNYQSQHGHCDVPTSLGKNHTLYSLGNWVSSQRDFFKKGTLSLARTEALKALGFRFAIRVDVGTWEDRLLEAKEFIMEHGHCDVPKSFKKYPKLLGFVNFSRTSYNNGSLSKDRIDKLNSINFNWAAKEGKDRSGGRWQENYLKLKEYKEINGRGQMPSITDSPALLQWARFMRMQVKAKRLSADRMAKLIDIGILETSVDYTPWETHFAQLEQYKLENGHVRVPKNYSKDPTFGEWVATMRRKVKAKELLPDKIEKLIQIGILEGSVTRKKYPVELKPWEFRFAQLQEFKRINGHVRVPQDYSEDPTFGHWVATMRHKVKAKKLQTDKMEKLIQIGILDESENYVSWEKRFAQLEEYKRIHGHVRVPIRGDDPTFGNWVNMMRHQVRAKKLPQDKIDKLIEIGILEK